MAASKGTGDVAAVNVSAKPRAAGTRKARAPKKLTEGEIQRRLAAIEPNWAGRPPSRFDAEITKGHASWKKLLAALADPDPQVRADAAQALAEVGAWEAVDALKKLLDDPAASVCSAAALALIRLGEKELAQELVRTLRDPDPEVAAGAATALGLARSRDHVPHLLAAFGTRDETLGAAVAHALGSIGDGRALEALLSALRGNFVPVAACEALGQLGDPAAHPVLLKALKHPDPDVRAAAARSLSAVERRRPKPDERLRESRLLPALRLLLEDHNARVRLSAALALHELGDEGAAAVLVELLGE